MTQAVANVFFRICFGVMTWDLRLVQELLKFPACDPGEPAGFAQGENTSLIKGQRQILAKLPSRILPPATSLRSERLPRFQSDLQYQTNSDWVRRP
jgi:hypothetical protein